MSTLRDGLQCKARRGKARRGKARQRRRRASHSLFSTLSPPCGQFDRHLQPTLSMCLLPDVPHPFRLGLQTPVRSSNSPLSDCAFGKHLTSLSWPVTLHPVPAAPTSSLSFWCQQASQPITYSSHRAKPTRADQQVSESCKQNDPLQQSKQASKPCRRLSKQESGAQLQRSAMQSSTASLLTMANAETFRATDRHTPPPLHSAPLSSIRALQSWRSLRPMDTAVVATAQYCPVSGASTPNA